MASETQEYLKWIDDRSSSVFWLYGILGSGKSVLTSTVIDDLLRRETDSPLKPLFFFLEHDNNESLQSGNILRCILRQCVTIDSLSTELEHLIMKTGRDAAPDPEDFVKAFQHMSEMSKAQFYIVVDGFDEASSGDRSFMLTFLMSLTPTDPGLKIFITSRQDIGNQIKSNLPVAFERSTDCLELDRDISNYIDRSIEDNYSSGRLVVGDLALLDQIREALRKKAKRM